MEIIIDGIVYVPKEENAKVEDAKDDYEGYIDFFTWLNALEELQYTEKGIQFYVDEYLKSINSR
jgi:hypothetical protein